MLTRWQFHVLSATSLLLIVLLIGNYALARSNENLSRQVAQARAVVAKGGQIENFLQQVAARLDQASGKEPEMGAVLAKCGLSVRPKTETNPETKGKGTQ